ncbi:TBC1 domain family member 23 [Pelomyxa schiedti]|nr:TBC1 domain family member 23 [Pelomyxa schiedti]
MSLTGSYSAPKVTSSSGIGAVVSASALRIDSSGVTAEAMAIWRRQRKLPPQLRADAWKAMLKVNSTMLSSSPASTLDERLLLAVSSTSHHGEFTSEGGVVVARLASIFCSSRSISSNSSNIKYVMEVASAFSGLRMMDQEGAACLAVIESRYLPHSLGADSPKMAVMTGLVRLFYLLVTYHDPVLASSLLRADKPHTFTHDWLCCLFAHTCSSLDIFLQLCDAYFLLEDSLLFMFMAVSLVMSVRKTLIASSQRELENLLNKLRISSSDQLQTLITRALAISSHTPSSFRKQLYSTMTDMVYFHAWIYSYLVNSPCLHISVLDMLADQKKKIPYYICDCRPQDHFDAGHLPEAHHIPLPDPSDKSASLDEFVQELKGVSSSTDGMKHVHIVLCGIGAHESPTEVDEEMNTALLALLKAGIMRISVFHRGYEGCHELFAAGKIELESHVVTGCSPCKTPKKVEIKKPVATSNAEVRKSSFFGRNIMDMISSNTPPPAPSPVVVQQPQENTPTPTLSSPLGDSPLLLGFPHLHTLFHPPSITTDSNDNPP